MSVRMVAGKLVDTDDPTPPPVEESPQTEQINNNPEGYPVCDACSQVNYEWVPGTRGRKPKYHADCKPIAPNRGAPRANTGIRNENALREALTQRYAGLAGILSLLHPAYGDGVRQKIAQAVEADLAYARVNPAFRRALEKALDKTALGEVIAIHAMMFAPVIVGESAKRSRKKAAGTADAGKRPTSPPSSSEGPRPTPPQGPPRQADVTPPNVHRIRDDMDMMPGEPEMMEETVNAGAMPGMPG